MSIGNSDFPIPADAQGFYQWDKLHCPRPQTMLTRDLFNSAITSGFSGAMDEFACPVGVTYYNFNIYAYIAIEPFEREMRPSKRWWNGTKPLLGIFCPSSVISGRTSGCPPSSPR
ncbi:MAG TPA: hypothetical protein DHW65_10060 [Dehalococcoidia bacterium]|nr:hypothetical protein [SAR202 cluster bacterium]HAA95396.1 hypothetical protein [Dehalococcoidia bacterium]HCL26672.1 hypothetical protein [Dehalococcoidia bacterium]